MNAPEVFKRLTIQLDITNCCNLNCIMCASKSYKHKSFMPFSTIEKVLKEIKNDFKHRPVRLFMHGEPLLHPDFIKLIKTARKIFTENGTLNVPTNKIDLSTNAVFLSPTVAKTIIESEIFGFIIFSVDAAREFTYSKIRRGGSYKKVIKNIQNFFKIRKTLNKQFPKGAVQFIVMDENFEEVGKFYTLWKNFFNSIHADFKLYFDLNADLYSHDSILFIKKAVSEKKEAIEEAIRMKNLHESAIKKAGILNSPISTKGQLIKTDECLEKSEKRKPCPAIFTYIGIHPDGSVSPCCIDHDAEFTFGNINNEKLKDIWYGRKLNILRTKHINAEFSNTGLCTNCRNLIPGFLDNSEILNYKKSSFYMNLKTSKNLNNKLVKLLFAPLAELQIDLTNLCNLKCPICYISWYKFKNKGFFPFQLYKKILDELIEFNLTVNLIKLYWIGEPLLHPDFLKFVEHSFNLKKEHRIFTHLMTSTNAQLLIPSFTDNFFDIMNYYIKKGVPENSFLVYVISTDAATQETYSKVRPNLSFDNLVKNVMYFLYKRKKYNLQYPFLTLQFVVQKENYHEAELFIKFWKEKFREFSLDLKVFYSWWHETSCDHIAFQPCAIHNEDSLKQTEVYNLYYTTVKSLKEKSKSLDPFGDYSVRFRQKYSQPVESELYEESRYISKTDRYPCACLYQTPNIKWNGDLMICCRKAISNENCLGNLHTHSLLELWTGELINKLRLLHIKGKFISECESCYTQEQWGRVPLKTLISFLKITKNSELIKKFLQRINKLDKLKMLEL